MTNVATNSFIEPTRAVSPPPARTPTMEGGAAQTPSAKKKRKGGQKEGVDGNAVFVRGLAGSATGEQLESFFSSVGPIRRSFVVTDGSAQRRCTGVGFVHFALHEDAQKAIEFLQGSALGGRKLRLEFARRRNRGGADAPPPGDADGGLRPKQPRAAHAAHSGGRAPPPTSTKGALSGSLAMRTVVVKARAAAGGVPPAEPALRALADNGSSSGFESLIVVGDAARIVFRSWPQAGRAAARIHGDEFDACVDALRGGKKCRLIIRNLPFKLLSSEFRKVFTDVAPVRDISLPTPKDVAPDAGKKDGVDGKEEPVRCRGFGFVEYFLAADANQAISKINGMKIGGRVVAVDLAIGKGAFLLKSEEEEEEATEALKEEAETEEVASEAEEKKKEVQEPETSSKPPPKKGKSTPEEMERTVFIRNLLYESSATELWQAMEERFGPVEQAVIVKDPMTGRPRGTAFVRFANAEQVESAITPGAQPGGSYRAATDSKSTFSLQGRNLLIVRATNRERARDLVVDGADKKEKNDPRNMRLAWIGTIKPDTPEARGMTESDFAKRVKAEQEKRAKLSSNPNAFISETRLSVRNLPRFVDEKFMKQMFLAALRQKTEAKKGDAPGKPKSFPKVTHTKVLRDPTRKDRSKGYGFIQFREHRHALQALHKLNNNPKALEIVLDANPKPLALDDEKRKSFRKQWGAVRRLIVEFSVEDKRQVAIIERVKEKGRAMKEAAAADNAGESSKSGSSKKRKGSDRSKGNKRRKINEVGTEDPSAIKKACAQVHHNKKNKGFEKRKRSEGSSPKSQPEGEKFSKKRPNQEWMEGKNEVTEKSKKKRKKKAKKEDDRKFDNMVALYKKKLSKTDGHKWYGGAKS